jgi:sugar phosphate isomerase/epimerase
MRFAMCNELLKHRGLEGSIRQLAALGYDGVEVAPWTIGEDVMAVPVAEAQRARTIAKESGIQIVGVHWVWGNSPEYHITHPDPAVRERSLRYLEHVADLCHAMGGTRFVFGSPKQRRILDGTTSDDAWAYGKEVLAAPRFLQRLQDHGIIFCIEPLSENQTNFITRTDQALRLVQEIGHPNFAMMLDGYSLTWEEDSIPAVIRRSGEHLRHFHADDETGKGPGAGTVDYRAVASALNEIGFSDYVSVEIHDFNLDPEATAKRCLDALRNAFAC